MSFVTIKRKNGTFRYWNSPVKNDNTSLQTDYQTAERYILSSYLPIHWNICQKVLDGYELKYPLDIYGIAHLRLILEDKMTGEFK